MFRTPFSMPDDRTRIALVVQNGMKDHLIDIANAHKKTLLENYVISTNGTAKYLRKRTGLSVDETMPSEKDGEDIKIANMVVDGDVDILVFLVDPMKVFSHSVAAEALMRECNVANIPLATNAATAHILLKYVGYKQ